MAIDINFSCKYQNLISVLKKFLKKSKLHKGTKPSNLVS